MPSSETVITINVCLVALHPACVHRKVVRRASLSDRHNLCRKEYETEAIVWRGGREEEEEKEKESDQENNQVINVGVLIVVYLKRKQKLILCGI